MICNKRVIYISRVKYTSTNIYVVYQYYFSSLPPKSEASMPLLLEMEGLSMFISTKVGGSMDDNTGDACWGGGREWSVHEEAHDMCEGQEEGSRGGSVDEKAHGDTCRGEGGGGGGGSVDKVAPDTCGGEEGGGGGGMYMDDARTDTNGLRR